MDAAPPSYISADTGPPPPRIGALQIALFGISIAVGLVYILIVLATAKHHPHTDFLDAAHAAERKAALHFLDETKDKDYAEASRRFLEMANAGDLIAWLHWAYIQPQYLNDTDLKLPSWTKSRVVWPVKKLADGGNAEAAYVLALYYANFQLSGHESDVRRYAKLSAEGGYVPAMIAYGYDLHLGYYGAKDHKAAQGWFEKAAATGDPSGMYYLASLLKETDYPGHDFAKAFGWYRKSADAGYIRGDYAVAWCYGNGVGTRVDRAAANEWLERGARLHDEECLYTLGTNYADGTDVKKDLKKARAYLEEASAQGFTEAAKALAELDKAARP